MRGGFLLRLLLYLPYLGTVILAAFAMWGCNRFDRLFRWSRGSP